MYGVALGGILTPTSMSLAQAAERLHDAPLSIVDSGNVNIVDVRAKARRMRSSKAGLALIIVDYLQLMRSPEYSDNRVQEISDISRSLKALARELEVPVIALSQLSRASEQRGGDRTPMLSDLRDSGAIEQDADVVLFVYREEYYLENREPTPNTDEHVKWRNNIENAYGKAEVIIGKQRHGPVGAVQLAFESQYTRFGNLAREFQLPERFE